MTKSPNHSAPRYPPLNTEDDSLKKKTNHAIYSNMDGPGGYHTKGNKSEKDIYHMIFLMYGILMNLFTKHQQTHRLRK